jgi:uncharacterized lipoprotein NlpE involved in copper resistance
MRTALAALAVTITLAGCKNRDADRDADDTARSSADTTITERKVEDTTIVTHDTIVRSDTIVKPGGTRDTSTRRP